MFSDIRQMAAHARIFQQNALHALRILLSGF